MKLAIKTRIFLLMLEFLSLLDLLVYYMSLKKIKLQLKRKYFNRYLKNRVNIPQ